MKKAAASVAEIRERGTKLCRALIPAACRLVREAGARAYRLSKGGSGERARLALAAGIEAMKELRRQL